MKRIFLISAFFTFSAPAIVLAQCSRTAPVFTFDNPGAPKDIHRLGSSPEFPFLRNMSSPQAVYSAIKRNETSKMNKSRMNAFNGLMMDIGFTNGTSDLTPSAIAEATLPYGTMGNMGSGDLNYSYSKLMDDVNGTKAWKISSGSDCYVYILAKCGNAFFPNSGRPKTACVTVPVSLSSEPKEVTLGNAPQNEFTDKVYVYYHRKKHSKRPLASEFSDVPDPQSSNPVLLSSAKRVEIVPQTYRVTATAPEDRLRVCPESTANVAASLNVEKISEYAGYYPGKAKKQYKEVSKRVYRKTARKMRKAERKENRVAAITGVTVNT